MNTAGKIFFWVCTILLGFVNPLISFGLIVLYYLPGIIQNLYSTCKEEQASKMNSFSEDVLEDMK